MADNKVDRSNSRLITSDNRYYVNKRYAAYVLLFLFVTVSP